VSFRIVLTILVGEDTQEAATEAQ
jgi:hypothetical protein